MLSGSLLLLVAGAGAAPVLQGLADWLAGLKYVPPQSGLFSATPATLAAAPAIRLDEAPVVFNNSGWLQPAGSRLEFLPGDQATNYYSALYWCQERDGRLAELPDRSAASAVRAVLARAPAAHHWLGLTAPRRTWSSGRPRNISDWAAGQPAGNTVATCTVLTASSLAWREFNCGAKQEGETGVRALCAREIEHQRYEVEAKEVKEDHHELKWSWGGNVEHCTCKTESSLDLVSFSDPRSVAVGRAPASVPTCPPGQKLSCTAVRPAPRSNITACLVHDVRLAVGGLLGKVGGVESGPACHALCLARPGCRYWTWRGDTRARKCFLLPRENRLVRRAMAAAGTVEPSLGCGAQLTETVQSREEEMEKQGDCWCEPQDLVGSGLIDPRSLPLGRIVSWGAEQCEAGWSRVCSPAPSRQQTGPNLFNSGLQPDKQEFEYDYGGSGLVGEWHIGGLPKREVDTVTVAFPK